MRCEDESAEVFEMRISFHSGVLAAGQNEYVVEHQKEDYKLESVHMSTYTLPPSPDLQVQFSLAAEIFNPRLCSPILPEGHIRMSNVKASLPTSYDFTPPTRVRGPKLRAQLLLHETIDLFPSRIPVSIVLKPSSRPATLPCDG